jgi:hypothetical protein
MPDYNDMQPSGGPSTDGYPPLGDRPVRNTICLFDVDDTLTPARNVSPPLPSSIRLVQAL